MVKLSLLFKEGKISRISDLEEAKRERIKVQYYTGTGFMREEYAKKSERFYESLVLPYLGKIKELLR